MQYTALIAVCVLWSTLVDAGVIDPPQKHAVMKVDNHKVGAANAPDVGAVKMTDLGDLKAPDVDAVERLDETDYFTGMTTPSPTLSTTTPTPSTTTPGTTTTPTGSTTTAPGPTITTTGSTTTTPYTTTSTEMVHVTCQLGNVTLQVGERVLYENCTLLYTCMECPECVDDPSEGKLNKTIDYSCPAGYMCVLVDTSTDPEIFDCIATTTGDPVSVAIMGEPLKQPVDLSRDAVCVDAEGNTLQIGESRLYKMCTVRHTCVDCDDCGDNRSEIVVDPGYTCPGRTTCLQDTAADTPSMLCGQA